MNTMVNTLEGTISAEPEPKVETSTAQPDDSIIENQLTQEITTLWSDHVRLSSDRKLTSKQLRQIRTKLAERLYEMKALLSRPGRSGQWRGWLREHKLPRSTADRLVARRAETLGGETENVLTEAISQPTDVDAEKLAKNTWQRIGKHLTTSESVIEFIDRFAELAEVGHEWRDDGLVIFMPVIDSTAASVPIPQPSDCASPDLADAIADPVGPPAVEQTTPTFEMVNTAAL